MFEYVYDTEAPGLIQEVDFFWCLVFKQLNKNNFYCFCDLKELSNFDQDEIRQNDKITFFNTDDYLKLINSHKTKKLVCHNQISFDLELMKKLNNVEYTHNSINSRELELFDSLIASRTLHPDRQLPKGCPTSILNTVTGRKDKIGPHSLDAWAYRTGIAKPTVHDWKTQPLDVYLKRCIEDTKNNEAAYFLMLNEIRDKANSNGEKHGNWENPIRMAHKNFWLIHKQENTGVLVDVEKGNEVLNSLDKELKELETELNPLFGQREISESSQPKFPKNVFINAFDYNKPFLKTGGLSKKTKEYLNKIGYTDTENQEKYISGMCNFKEVDGVSICENNIHEMIKKHHSLLTSSAVNYCLKFGIDDPKEQLKEIKRVLSGDKPKKLVEEVGLKDTQAVKEFLVREGWVPTLWNYRNVLIHPQTKQKFSKEETQAKVEKYIHDFRDHIYWPFILEELGYSKKSKIDPDSEAFHKKCIRFGRNLLSSPMYKDQNGIRCPNLKEMTGDTSKKIIRYLSLKHRRSLLKSTKKKKKDTHGLLNNPRLKIDSRVSAGVAGCTSTNRKRHRGVVNIPGPNSVYGKEIRSLFIAPQGWYNIGADACSVEALIASHYTIPFDGGAYAKDVTTGKFHDNNAILYSEVAQREISRGNGKNITYALIYGVAAAKLARMMSVSQDVAKVVIDNFWETNIGLKGVRDALVSYWERTGKKYIMGLDGRKLYSRSQHSLMNLLFQGTGSILLDYVLCYWEDKCTQEGLNVQRWIEVHDELQSYQREDEVKIYTFNSTPENELPVDDEGKPQRKKDALKPEQERDGLLYSAPKFLDGRWQQAYSRAGELVDSGFRSASKYYGTNVEFRAEYMYGRSWSECH